MKTSPRAQRLLGRPVVEAGAVPGYEAIFNAGLLHHVGVYHLFARGIRTGYRRNPRGEGPRFLDYVSDVLVFESVDGLAYQFKYVIAQAGVDGSSSFEDPRVQRVHSEGGDHVVMTFTHLLPDDGEHPWRIGMRELVYRAGRFSVDPSIGGIIGPGGIPNKDGVVFNLADAKVALLHRVYPSVQVAIFDSLNQMTSADGAYWREHMVEINRHTIIVPARSALGVGAGAPPVLSEAGPILFFHERRADGSYTMNVALLDARNGRVVARLDEPLLEPELPWEREGDSAQGVVFVEGAHRRDDGTIYLTYGAGDRSVGAAVVEERHLLEALEAAAR